MTELSIEALQRENSYLKQRCAQLQDDVTDLGAQVVRLTEQLDRVTARRAERLAQANPLSGGQ